MASMSDYLENELLDHALGTGSWTMPAQCYLALYTAAPSDSGGGTQVSGSGYARQAIDFGAATGGVASNTPAVSFTPSGGNYGTITHWGIFDASTAGNMLFHGALSASRVANDGDTITFGVGAITITAA